MHTEFSFRSVFQNSLFLVIGILLFKNCAADLVLTAPPRESILNAKAMYEPIAKQLSQLLGEPVVYQRPSGWFDYSKKMRGNEYDIVFDGPHFTAWRVKHLKHIPVASLPGQLKFLLVSEKENTAINNLVDLTGQKICGILSPNLGTDLILAQYSNPVIQPIIYSVTGNMRDVFQNFKQGKCKAAILRDVTYINLPEQDKNALRIIYQTKAMPNQAITISPRLHQYRKKLSTYITSTDGADAAKFLLSRYSNKARYFVPAASKNYRGAEDLIEGVVFGW